MNCSDATLRYNELATKIIAERLNSILMDAIKYNDFSGKMFAKGRVEKGNSLSLNERSQGGIFWLRPQEAKVGQLDWGFTQVVGHNPGFEVRGIWGPNFIETDVGTLATKKVGAYVDTPYLTMRQARILTEKLPGIAPEITGRIQVKLMVTAMRDTIADFFLGWDGRIEAIKAIKRNSEFVKAYIKEINAEIKIRKQAGDTKGIQLLNRMKYEITSPEGRDYLYGGIGFWRDIVMGRQNSVKVMDAIPKMSPSQLSAVVVGIGTTAKKIMQLSKTDIERMFGMSKEQIGKLLDISGLRKSNIESYRVDVLERSRALVDIVDRGLEESVVPYLDREKVAAAYSKRLQSSLDEYYRSEEPYDASYVPRGFDERTYRVREERVRSEIQREITRQLRERVDRYSRQVRSARVPYVPRGTRVPRVPREPRSPKYVPRPPYAPYPPYPPYPPYTPRPPYPPYPPTQKKLPQIELESRTRKGPKIPEGSIAWKQGIVWKYIPPPWTQEKPISLRHPPKGAKFIGEKTPEKTVQMIGTPGAPVPKDVSIDLGVVDIRVSNYGQKIEFTGKGLETKVGKTLRSPTMGMSIPASGVMRVRPRHKVKRHKRSGDRMLVGMGW